MSEDTEQPGPESAAGAPEATPPAEPSVEPPATSPPATGSPGGREPGRGAGLATDPTPDRTVVVPTATRLAVTGA